PAPTRVNPPRRPPRPDRELGRALPWGIGGSVLLHLIFLLSAPLFIQTERQPGDGEIASLAKTGDWLRMIEPVVVSSPEAREEEPPAETGLAERTHPPARRGGPSRPALRTPAGERASAAEALRPGSRDPRLYVAPRDLPEPPEPSDHERYLAHLEARLGAYNDSIAGAAERSRRATDWTVTDSEGRRWGVSPGKIHLGGVTLPLPVGFGGSPERADEWQERQRQREEIRRQEEARERDEVREERNRSARERDPAGLNEDPDEDSDDAS
ncbi:MAG: hypothetical protein ACREKN_05745, partial [Longimicrobiaceae bacterium]